MRIWKWGFVASAALLVILFAVGLFWPAAATAPVKEGVLTAPSESLEEVFQVTPGDFLPEQARCESSEFNSNSLSGDLLFVDSVSTPFVASDPEKMLEELLKENCGNPTLLRMEIEALSATPIEEGVTIGDVNPWMSEFLGQGNLLEWVGKNEEGKLFVTSEFTDAAEMVNTILLRSNGLSVGSAQTLSNWHIPLRSAFAVGELPIAALNPNQYMGEFLQLAFTLKGKTCPELVVGFNTGDKRFATLESNCGGTPPQSPPSTPPPSDDDIQVCLKQTGDVVTIASSAFDGSLHSKDLSKCVKSSNPDDYVSDSDGNVVEGDAEASPPAVETEAPGGRGIVDSPGTPPGSESGVTAPGATPPPTVEPSLPPNEGTGGTPNTGDGGGW